MFSTRDVDWKRVPYWINVMLTKEESAFAVKAAKIQGREGRKDPRFFSGEENQIPFHIIGNKGEMAVRRAFGMDPMALKVRERGGDGGRGDVPLPSGRTASVKTNSAMYGVAIFGINDMSEMQDDVGILCSPRVDILYDEYRRWYIYEPTLDAVLKMRICGWITKEDWYKYSVGWKVKWGTARGISPHFLRDIRVLLKDEGIEYGKPGGMFSDLTFP